MKQAENGEVEKSAKGTSVKDVKRFRRNKDREIKQN